MEVPPPIAEIRELRPPDPPSGSAHSVLAFAHEHLVARNELPAKDRAAILRSCVGAGDPVHTILDALGVPEAAGPASADGPLLVRLTAMVREVGTPWPDDLAGQLQRVAGARFHAWADLLTFVAIARAYLERPGGDA